MAKRFTDTDKWKREWFCELNLKAKAVWFYILDNCDHRGVWFENFKLLSAQLGTKVTKSEFETWFKGKVRPFDGDKYFIPSFVAFQYGELNPSNNAHRAIVQLVEKLDSLVDKVAPHEDLGSPLGGAQDKDKDKDKEKEEGECEGKQTQGFDFDSVYQAYPRKEGKVEGMTRLRKRIRSAADFEKFAAAVRRYAGLCRTENRKREHILLWSSFVGTEGAERWLDYAPATQPFRTMSDTPPSQSSLQIEPSPSPPPLSKDEAAKLKQEIQARFGKVGA